MRSAPDDPVFRERLVGAVRRCAPGMSAKQMGMTLRGVRATRHRAYGGPLSAAEDDPSLKARVVSIHTTFTPRSRPRLNSFL